MKPPLLVVAGPTGVGKTATALALAGQIPIEVVSADSRQVYRFMDVATGKPTAAERRALVHYLIDVVDPDDRYDAARFRHDAATNLAAIHASGKLPLVVGGTGLYIRALLRGLDPAPPADPDFRRELASVLARRGGTALHERLGQEAPEMAQRLHPNDHVRIVRALERLRWEHAFAREQARWTQPGGDYRVCYVALTMERRVLAARLRARARAMAADGLIDEVRHLLARGYDESLPAMGGIGYRQFIQVVRGTMSWDDAMRHMERDTMQYAKRQWTWFAREPDVRWIDVDEAGGPEGVARRIEGMVREEGLIE